MIQSHRRLIRGWSIRRGRIRTSTGSDQRIQVRYAEGLAPESHDFPLCRRGPIAVYRTGHGLRVQTGFRPARCRRFAGTRLCSLRRALGNKRQRSPSAVY